MVSAHLQVLQRQLAGLLQVAGQVAQTPIVDLHCLAVNSAWRSPNLQPAELESINWLVHQVVTAKRAIVVPEMTQLPQVAAFLSQSDAATPVDKFLSFYAGFPVKTPAEIKGVLSLVAYQGHSLTSEQQGAIATIADQIGYLLDAIAAEALVPLPQLSPPQRELPLAVEASESTGQSQNAVLKVSMALQECLAFEDLNNTLISILPVELPITAFQLVLFKGLPSPQVVCLWHEEGCLPPQKDIVCQNVENLPHCILNRKRTQDVVTEQTDRQDADFWRCYDLKVKHQMLGALKVALSAEAMPAAEQKAVGAALRQIAEQIGATIYRLQFFKRLQTENLLDPLTNLFNRRHMMSVLKKLLQRVKFGQYQVGLILFDIDHFKRINDTYGHDAGDHVLRVLGLFLKGHARPNDAVCRFGGEEFAILLPDVTLEVTAKRAERLCRSIKYLSIKVGETPVAITLSAGFAIAPDHATTPATLLKAADEALYEAKRTGRDRAVSAQIPQENPSDI